MKNFPFIHEGREYWFSRANTAGMFVFCKDPDGDWCILANKRGKGCPNGVGLWNVPGGYLDFNETLKDCALRECKEETGVIVDKAVAKLFSMHSIPKGEFQNLSFKFYAKITDKKTTDFIFSYDLMETDEVADIKWIKIKDVDSYSWAFRHLMLIKEIYHTVIHPSFCNFIKNTIASLFNLSVVH